MSKILVTDEANRLLIAFSDAAKRLIGRRTLLESHMFPVTTYVATGLYNLHEIGYESLREVTNSASPEEIGRLGRRLLSRINQKTHFSTILGYLVGREQRLMDKDVYSTLDEDDVEQTMFMLNFFQKVVSNYRSDDKLFVADGNGTIQILPEETLEDLSGSMLNIDQEARVNLRRMLALLQSYLFLSNCESRGNVFSHGPYGKNNLIIREFTSLKSGPLADYLDISPPVKNLAVVLELGKMKPTMDEVGTLYVDQPDYMDQVENVGLFTVSGSKAEPLPASTINDVSQFAQRAQKTLFYKAAKLDDRQKIVAGALQYSNLFPYYEAVGEPHSFTPHLGKRCQEIDLPKMISLRIHPFFNRFGEKPNLFTPLEDKK
ncbi:MAG: hypothetical protein M1503_11600 [Thaumarchaeota archaeon]|nr:hypothetical protein [Nitrososphaerota archaeon]MCL5318887.1 hypothetical protein [Nitrososphaerota archaeon]